MRCITIIVLLLITVETYAQKHTSLLDHPEEVAELLQKTDKYPYYNGKEVVFSVKQSNTLALILDEALSIKIQFNYLDSINQTHTLENSKLISSVDKLSESTLNLTEINRNVTDMATTNYQSNVRSYREMATTYEKLVDVMGDTKEETKKWRKRAAVIAVLAVLEGALIYSLL